jgi:hypothetical protein
MLLRRAVLMPLLDSMPLPAASGLMPLLAELLDGVSLGRAWAEAAANPSGLGPATALLGLL